MQENGLIEYKPIKFQVRKKLSDTKMILKSEKFLNEMSLRHTIRDFSDKKVPFNVIKNCIKVACLHQVVQIINLGILQQSPIN